MNNTKLLLAVGATLTTTLIFAQEAKIDTVYIIDHNVDRARKTQQVYDISKENIEKNPTNLSETLRFQSPVFIKENGRGMTSSPSFRGTTAQQTAFVWNGINVNSVFLGQGDINNLSLMGYDNLEVKSGGGGVIYGSGAIGGSVHMNNDLPFNQGFISHLFAEYASFDTYNTSLKSHYSNHNVSVAASINYIQSENDYKVPERYNYINRSGQYHNTTANVGAAYKFNSNKFFFQAQYYNGLQNFPLSTEAATKTKYSSQNLRSLLGWEFSAVSLKNTLTAAFIEERFGYYDDIDAPKTSGGIGKTYLLKNNLGYQLSPAWSMEVLSEIKQNMAEGLGTSGIEEPKRISGLLAGTLAYQPSPELYLEGGLRKEWIEKTDTPILYSLGMKYKFSEYYTLKFNASRNFRYPTFNDLYWQPGGNLDLKSETSYQVDLGNVFKLNDIQFSLTPYIIHIKDMIQWLPTSEGYWSPINTSQVQSYGLEAMLNMAPEIAGRPLQFNLGYTYTHSENRETKKQLMYVPFHKIFGMAQYDWNNFDIFFQGIFQGVTYTTSDESKNEALDPYAVLNAGAGYTFYDNFRIGLKANNLTNTIYETVSYYPLPKRNYSLNLTINF